MKILIFTHYFPPEVNAPATRTYEHAVRWVRAGHDVTVVTCAPNCPDGVLFPGYKNAIRPQTETVDGIRVVRVWTYLAPNAGTVRRIANFVSYMLLAFFASWKLPKPDVVLATSPQFFCGWAGVLASKWKRAPFVLEIRDIWPESIAAVGALRSRPLLRFLEWLERRMYRAADHIVAVGDGYRRNIEAKVDVGDRISVVMNGVDLDAYQPREPDPRLLHQWDLENAFVVAYVGTIGMAHGLEVVLDAAAILNARGRSDIRFLIVGDGAEQERLAARARAEQLDALVVFAGRQAKDRIPNILASANACLVHLRPCELFETVIPSKIFESLAMERPIVMGVRGDARALVDEAEAGVNMEPGSAEDLVRAAELLADNRDLAEKLGKNGRVFVAAHFRRDVLAARMLDVLTQVAEGVRPVSDLGAEPQGSANQVPARIG